MTPPVEKYLLGESFKYTDAFQLWPSPIPQHSTWNYTIHFRACLPLTIKNPRWQKKRQTYWTECCVCQTTERQTATVQASGENESPTPGGGRRGFGVSWDGEN